MKASQTFAKVRRLKDAPLIIQSLNNEVSDMHLIVVDMSDFLQNAENNRSSTSDSDKPIFELCSSTLKQASQKIQEVEIVISCRLLKRGQDAGFEINKTAYLREHHKLALLQAELREHRQRISGLCSHLGMKEASKIHVLLTGLSNDLPKQIRSRERIEKTLNRMMDLQLATSKSTNRKPLHEAIEAEHGSDVPRLPGFHLSISRQPYSTFKRSCTCYSRALRTQLQSIFGSLFLGYVAVPLVGCHGEGGCSPHKDTVLRLSYFFPFWFLRYVVLLQTRFSSYGNVMCSINIRQVIPYDHVVYDLLQLGDADGVRQLLITGQISLEAQGPLTGTMLHGSILYAKATITKALIEMGASTTSEHHIWGTPQKTVWSLILARSKSGEWRAKMRSLFPNPDFEELYGFSSLHKAVLGLIDQSPENTLQANPSQINKTDYDGRTALSWAAARGDKATIRALLMHAPDCNKADVLGRTPLSFAVMQNRECTEILLQANADIHRRDFVDGTVLMRAIQYLYPESEAFPLTKFFVQAGVDVNAKNVEGETALFFATTRNYARIAWYLMRYGADPKICDKHGRSIFTYATMMNRHALIYILLEDHEDHTERLDELGTLAHVAATFGDVKTLQLLARGGLKRRNINEENKAGLTPMQVALQRKDVNVEWRHAFFDFLRSIDEDQPELGLLEVQGTSMETTKVSESTEYNESEGEFEDALEAQV